jgi:hypothetical protein
MRCTAAMSSGSAAVAIISLRKSRARRTISSKPSRASSTTNGVSACGALRDQPNICWRCACSRRCTHSAKPKILSPFVSTRYTGNCACSLFERVASAFWILAALCSTASRWSCNKPSQGTTNKMPLAGHKGRKSNSISKKACHSSSSAAPPSWVNRRPAKSRITASSVNHQSHPRVPPTPESRVCPKGKCRSEFWSMMLLPDCGSPTSK